MIIYQAMNNLFHILKDTQKLLKFYHMSLSDISYVTIYQEN